MKRYSFDSLIGNIHVLNVLKRELSTHSLGNFVIFEGEPGTGKSTCAEIIALYKGCDSPANGNPCLECSRCLSNIKTLESGNSAMNFIKYNMAHEETKASLNQIITTVFKNAAPIHEMVYIFEEFHMLSKYEQSSFLEEFRTLSDNVFVIATTTKLTDIIPEMRSRADIYSFKRLTRAEMRLLLRQMCKEYHIKTLSTDVENMMMEHSKGIPRNLIKIFEHAVKSNMTIEELSEFCGTIPNSVFLDLFEVMHTSSLVDTVSTIEYMLDSYRYTDLLNHLFEYMVNVTFYLSGGVKNIFSTKEVSRLRAVMTLDHAFKISALLESSRDMTESKFKLLLLRVFTVLNPNSGKVPQKEIASQVNVATQNHTELKRMNMETQQVKPLGNNDIKKLLSKEV